MKDAISLVKSIENPKLAIKNLIEIVYVNGSVENITSIVVRFHHT